MQTGTARRHLIAFVFISLPLAGLIGAAQSQPPTPSAAKPAGIGESGLQIDAIDRTADPCTDFYQFACGGWVAKNPIPAERSSFGRFEELAERNNEILHRILERAGTASARDAETQKIGDYYASCMDEAGINAKGLAPLELQLQQIAALSSLADLPRLVASLHVAGTNAFFRTGSVPDARDASMQIAVVAQGGLGLPERDYYFRTDPKSTELRKQYAEHVGKMLALAGSTPEQASAGADTVMRMETALARGALDVVARRDPSKTYHKMTIAELQHLAPVFEWTRYLSALKAPPLQSLNVMEPDFMKAFSELVTSTPIDDIKTYLRWHVLHGSATVLPVAFVNENFRFYGTTLTGAKELRPRWKRCVQYTDGDLGEAVGKAFVAEAFGPNAKADTLKTVHEIESALEQDLLRLNWMTEATKKEAFGKLHAVTDKIGYPDRWRDYGALTIVRGDALGNSLRANTFDFNRAMAKVGRPVDRSEWLMSPPTVNAYYNPLENNINFPAGILQPPFYSAKADPAVNYGAAGAVVGHELTHGFDDQGRHYDANGNLRDWWTPEDAKAFTDRAQCLVDQYSAYTAVEDVKVNGKLTLGENTADNGGLRLSLAAFLATRAVGTPNTLDGFTAEQRFFVGWGQIWCENQRPEVARLYAQTDPHAPGRYRVNGTVSNMPEFQKAFSCKADAPMVSQNVCRVW